MSPLQIALLSLSLSIPLLYLRLRGFPTPLRNRLRPVYLRLPHSQQQRLTRFTRQMESLGQNSERRVVLSFSKAWKFAASSYRRLQPPTRKSSAWLWVEIFKPVWLKFLEIAGPKIYGTLFFTFSYETVAETSGVVPSIPDWLWMFYNNGIEWGLNMRAGTEAVGGIDGIR